jgi:hypothetical protein
MIDPRAQAALNDLIAALNGIDGHQTTISTSAAALMALVPQLPDPPPRVPVVRVGAAVALIEGAEASFIPLELLDGPAPYDLEFRPALVGGEATADDLDFGPAPVIKKGTEVILWPLRAKPDDLVEGTETARIKFSCTQVVAFDNDTVLVTITDTTPVQPPAPPNLDPVTIFKKAINAGDHIFSSDWDKWFERYERGIKRRVMYAGETHTITLYRKNSMTGGTTLNHTAFQYALFFGATEIARCLPNGKYDANFTFAVDTLPAALTDAPYQLGLKQYDAQGNEVPLPGNAFVPTFVYLNRHGKLKDAPWFVSYASSFKCFRNGFNFGWSIIPRHFIFNDDGTFKTPKATPLDATEADVTNHPRAAWTTMQPSSEFTAIQLNEYLREDHMIMTRDRTGAPAFEGMHCYTIAEPAFAGQWVQPFCDGPRGIARVICPTDPQPARLGGGVVMEIRAVSRVNSDGFKTTLFGKRVPGWPAIHNQDAALIEAESEWVGNWSLVPVDKWGIDQSWTWRFDQRTIKKGSGPDIVNDGRTDGVKEPAHDERPCMLVPRPQPKHSDLLEAYFAKDSHNVPAELRIGIANMRSPWGVDITDDGIVLITEQSGPCISAYQRGLDGSYTKLWEVSVNGRPQGIGHDGQGNVYFGNRADFALYRFNMNDPARAVTKFAQCNVTAKSWFCSVHVNRDPETGGIFISASTNNENNFGNPETWRPDGTRVNPFPVGFAPHGLRGGTAATYAMPARAGNRVLMRGGSDIGLVLWRLKRPGDIDYSEAGYYDAAGFHRQFTDDAAKWEAEGFDLVFGPHATSSICIDQPIGYAPWCDRFISVCRHYEANPPQALTPIPTPITVVSAPTAPAPVPDPAPAPAPAPAPSTSTQFDSLRDALSKM